MSFSAPGLMLASLLYLILLFGVHPASAVGTDLLYASATKTGGSVVHGWSRTIYWPAVLRLASGSIPASIITLICLAQYDLNSAGARSLINLVLCFATSLHRSRWSPSPCFPTRSTYGGPRPTNRGWYTHVVAWPDVL